MTEGLSNLVNSKKSTPTLTPACHSRAERRISQDVDGSVLSKNSPRHKTRSFVGALPLLEDDNIGFIVMYVVLDKTDLLLVKKIRPKASLASVVARRSRDGRSWNLVHKKAT